MQKRINVTKAFLPPIEEYEQYLDEIWENEWITNQGPLLKEFELRAKKYLLVNDFQFVANGTVAMQVALRALGINGADVITTPFSYVATTSALLWEGCNPIYVDIDPDGLCIDPEKIEDAITPNTKAILAVHVFGNACDVDKIEKIAKRHNLKVIYDGAHAFGAKYHGKSLLNYGDITTCSFHATKLFNTIEGGCIISKDKAISRRVELIKRFGHDADEHITLGINAKASEFQAAMGLCNLPYVNEIIAKRGELCNTYDSILNKDMQVISTRELDSSNFAYYPILLKSEEQVKEILELLSKHNIFARRYFYPSLNKLIYLGNQQVSMPISEDISKRILCLPLYFGLQKSVVRQIAEIINNEYSKNYLSK